MAPPQPCPPRARGRVEPLGAERYKVQFTADKAWVDKLREATALLSHRLPGGDMAEVLDQALTALCEKLMKERFAVPTGPGRAASAQRDEPANAAAVVPAVAAPAAGLSEEPAMEKGASENGKKPDPRNTWQDDFHGHILRPWNRPSSTSPLSSAGSEGLLRRGAYG